jgi:hypothetical protein
MFSYKNKNNLFIYLFIYLFMSLDIFNQFSTIRKAWEMKIRRVFILFFHKSYFKYIIISFLKF